MAAMNYRLIVIGSGISGLFVALEARALGPVLVLTKGSIEDTNTRWAQGGIAAAIGPLDSVDQHLADTIAAGAGLVDEEAARILCSEAPARIHDLVDYGVDFDAITGEVALGREAAHSRARVLHAGGDRTGAAIESALSARLRGPSITVFDYTVVTRLIVDRGAVTGVEALDLKTGNTEVFEAPAVVIATGGAGQLYSHTTNPAVATGDGISLAFEAGAEVADLEFIQFHPTAFRREGHPAFLISEAVRGDGAVLRNAGGEAFMPRYHDLADLAPRDVVARAIVREMRRAGSDHVLLDCTGLKVDPAARFPGIYAFCRDAGIDMSRQPIPVAPAAHYIMGGVRTDVWGRTTIENLYACGEVACTGVHGANRLASNSLMETVIFGKRVVDHLASGEGGAADGHPDAVAISLPEGEPSTLGKLQQVMWTHAGIERDGEGLRAALEVARDWRISAPAPTRDWHERHGAAALAQLVLHSALERTESRGAHYRTDYPCPDDERWRHHQVYRYAP